MLRTPVKVVDNFKFVFKFSEWKLVDAIEIFIMVCAAVPSIWQFVCGDGWLLFIFCFVMFRTNTTLVRCFILVRVNVCIASDFSYQLFKSSCLAFHSNYGFPGSQQLIVNKMVLYLRCKLSVSDNKSLILMKISCCTCHFVDQKGISVAWENGICI